MVLKITISLLPKCLQLSVPLDFFSHGNKALIIIKPTEKYHLLYQHLLYYIYSISQEIDLFVKFLQKNNQDCRQPSRNLLFIRIP